VNNWGKADLGFEDGKFPPEKTIYLTLLKENGVHKKINGGFELGKPNSDSSFIDLWQECEEFLESAKQEKRKITELIDVISKRPFKLKLGLIDFWLPTYLFIKRVDYALYDKGIYVPYINETKLYEITRNPQYYELKTFEITGIRLKLFNKYREFLQQEKKTKFSNEVFIESIRPFLVFYKNLTDYAKNTQRLSDEAISLRQAIINAKDPEKTFFEDFPAALRLNLEDLAQSDKSLCNFARIINNALEEIKNSYPELVKRIEGFILEEVVGENIDFPEYKDKLQKRFASIKKHQLLSQQQAFLQRVDSPLDHRESWIASIAQAVIQKPLDQISDKEEHILKDKLLYLVKELDNLRIIHIEQQALGEEVIKLELTTLNGGLRTSIVQIPKSKVRDIDKLAKEIDDKLKNADNLSIAVLAKLLSKRLNDE